MPQAHRPTLDLDLLRDFLALAELRGFGRAAERRSITQSALSRRIQRLVWCPKSNSTDFRWMWS